MNALELVELLKSAGDQFQLHVNAFVDTFRTADDDARTAMLEPGPSESGRFEGLVSAVASALCREIGRPAPVWTQTVWSPEPFFVIDTESYALRVRLMLESPPPFRVRRVFVPENYLARA